MSWNSRKCSRASKLIYILFLPLCCVRWRCRFSWCMARQTRWRTQRWAGRCTNMPAARTRPWNCTQGCGTAWQRARQTTTLKWFSRTSYHGWIGTLMRLLSGLMASIRRPLKWRLLSWWTGRSRLRRGHRWGICAAWRAGACAIIHLHSFLLLGEKCDVSDTTDVFLISLMDLKPSDHLI